MCLEAAEEKASCRPLHESTRVELCAFLRLACFGQSLLSASNDHLVFCGMFLGIQVGLLVVRTIRCSIVSQDVGLKEGSKAEFRTPNV